MKKALITKVIFCLLLMTMIITVLSGITFANNANLEKVQIIKKSEDKYIIYVSYENESNELVLLNEKFEFAFSNQENVTDKTTLEFKDSALDKEDNGHNIAYIETDLYTKYFQDKEDTYIWVKKESDYILEAEKIDLKKSITEEEIQTLNNLTKTIEVTVGEKILPTEDDNGVKVNRKVGTLVIKEQTGKYSYEIVKASEGTDAAKLIELAKNLNAVEQENIFNKLAAYNEFKEIYNKLKPELDDKYWEEVKDYTVEQPQNSKTGEQYLVWLKHETDNGTKIDVQIMTCVDEYIQEYEKQEVVIKETTKLPITGDNIILFVIAGVILALIIIVLVLKLKNKKENK